MKNLNKLAMGILVGALAIGFSAFKSDTVTVKYFRTTGSASSINAADYHYRPDASCLSTPATNCSFQVKLASAPAIDSNPTQAQVNAATISQGSYSE